MSQDDSLHFSTCTNKSDIPASVLGPLLLRFKDVTYEPASKDLMSGHCCFRIKGTQFVVLTSDTFVSTAGVHPCFITFGTFTKAATITESSKAFVKRMSLLAYRAKNTLTRFAI